MANETKKKEVSGLELLRQPVTLALARYLNDLHSGIGFQAYLWRMIVNADYGHGDVTKFPKPSDPRQRFTNWLFRKLGAFQKVRRQLLLPIREGWLVMLAPRSFGE